MLFVLVKVVPSVSRVVSQDGQSDRLFFKVFSSQSLSHVRQVRSETSDNLAI